jgi:coenzyme F420-reducing hydrogenase delta subunit
LVGCDHAFDISQLESPNIAPLNLFCTGMIPPTLVEYALKKGADGVFITGCRTGDCYFRKGNVWLDRRFSGERKPELRPRAERARIAVVRAAETDGAKLRRELAEFERAIALLNSEGTTSADASGDEGGEG